MSSPAFDANASFVEREVQRIRELMKSQHYAAALAVCATLTQQVPENRDVLYLTAVCQRYLRDIKAALATLARLERHHPLFSLLLQERGHCYVALKDAPNAIDS